MYSSSSFVLESLNMYTHGRIKWLNIHINCLLCLVTGTMTKKKKTITTRLTTWQPYPLHHLTLPSYCYSLLSWLLSYWLHYYVYYIYNLLRHPPLLVVYPLVRLVVVVVVVVHPHSRLPLCILPLVLLLPRLLHPPHLPHLVLIIMVWLLPIQYQVH